MKVSWKATPVYLLLILLLFFARPTFGTFALGFPLVCLGEGLRLWAAGHLQKNREVTTSGPYAHLKNPLYLGTLLIAVGYGIITGQPILLGVAGAGFFFYYVPFKKRRESERLEGLFGERWKDYDRLVPDYLPRLSPYERREIRRWSWSCVRANSEHETAAAVATGTLLLTLRIFR